MSPWRTVLRQFGFGAVVFAILWLLGHHTAAVVVLVIAGSVSILCALSARCRQSRGPCHSLGDFDRRTRLELRPAWDTRVPSFYADCGISVARPSRSFGSRVVAELERPFGARTSLTVVDRSIGRQFTYEVPRRVVGRRSALGRLAFVIGAVVLLMLADLGVGSILHALTNPNPQSEKSLTSYYSKVAAVPKTSWWPSVLLGSFDQAYLERFQPMRGFAGPDNFSSPYFNISDGVRRSYEPPVSGTQKPVEVLFLGGSTMEGAFQRDDYTISSDVARLAGS